MAARRAETGVERSERVIPYMVSTTEILERVEGVEREKSGSLKGRAGVRAAAAGEVLRPIFWSRRQRVVETQRAAVTPAAGAAGRKRALEHARKSSRALIRNTSANRGVVLGVVREKRPLKADRY